MRDASLVDSGSEGPWCLPNGWVWTRLGDVLQPVASIDPRRVLQDEGFHYIDLSSIEAGQVLNPKKVAGKDAPSRARQVVRAGDTLFSCVRVYLKNVALLSGGFSSPIASTAFCVMRPRRAVDPRYLNYFVQTQRFIEWMLPLQRGNSPPAVLEGDLKAQSFPVPPLAEQRRIVAHVDALFAEIAEGEAALAEARKGLDIFRRALLKAAVTGELTRDWRAKNLVTETARELLVRIAKDRESMPVTKRRARLSATPKPLDTASLSVLPESWSWVRAEEITSLITKGTTPPQHTMTREGEIPYLKIQNLDFDGRLHFDRTKQFIDRDTHSAFLARSKIYPGDLLINIVGPPLGQTAVVPSDFPEWNINQAIAVLRCLPGIVVDYVNLFLMSPAALAEFEMRSKATSGQVNVTLEVCRNVAVPLPPSAEASEIVRQVSEAVIAMDETFHVLDAEAADAARLKQSILKAAFEGRLVPQDATDEPASALLARIAADRSDVPAKRGRAKLGSSIGLETP